MDLNQLVSMLSGLGSNPNATTLLMGFALAIAYKYARKKFPWLPNIFPSDPSPAPSPTPSPSPSPVPSPASDHPILDSLLKILGGSRAATVLASEVHRMISEQTPPEPSIPVK